MALIQLDNLTRHYGARRGIERISLSVAEGVLFGFLGPNGAGKTTTIRVLLGFLRPGGGAARIFGLDCWRQSKAIKRDVGYLPGDLHLASWMNGAAAVSIYGTVRGSDLTRPSRQLAERFGLDLRVKVRDMSRGMRQKLGLILALAHSPRLLVLDEPTNSLDPLMQQTLHEYLRQLAAAGTPSSSPATRWARWNNCVSASPSCATESWWPMNPSPPCANGPGTRSPSGGRSRLTPLRWPRLNS